MRGDRIYLSNYPSPSQAADCSLVFPKKRGGKYIPCCRISFLRRVMLRQLFYSKKVPPRVISSFVAKTCQSLQLKLVDERVRNVNPSSLPRSTMLDSKYILAKELFSDYVEYTSLHDLITWKLMAERHERYNKKFLEEHLPVRKPNMQMLSNPDVNYMQATWLGHASVLAQWDGWNVLTDPIFSKRSSPTQLFGPKRARPPPAMARDLPPVDICVISHNHYDHLDLQSVVALATIHPDLIWVVPLGMKEWFLDINITSVIEMDWSEQIHIEDNSGRNRPTLAVQCVPCQHWSARTPFDRNECLWASWATSTPRGSFFFGGDTGYCSLFAQVGALFAPKRITLAALPIGAYGSTHEKWLHRPNHLNPAEAVQTHIDLRAKASLGIHWGTFLVTGEPIMEPPALLEEAKKSRGLGQEEFVVCQHGETKIYPLDDTPDVDN